MKRRSIGKTFFLGLVFSTCLLFLTPPSPLKLGEGLGKRRARRRINNDTFDFPLCPRPLFQGNDVEQ